MITPRAGHDAVAAPWRAALPAGIVTADSDALGSPVSVLTVAGAKGLEFDAVVLVEPAAHRGRVAARAQRPLRRADPADAAAARRARGRLPAGM